MQFFPQQQFGGFIPQAQQCSSCPGYNNYFQQQQQYPQFSALYPQQYYPQQLYYPQQFNYPQQQQQFYYPQQQQLYYPQQQQQFYYPQQQCSSCPQPYLGQNAYGFQQYWPQQQRVYEDSPTPPPTKHKKKGEPKVYYERYY